MADRDPQWTLIGFLDRLDDWIKREHPSDDLVLLTSAWIFSRYEDPFRGVRREAGFENLWFGEVSGSEHGRDHVVVCSYWIVMGDHSLRCDAIASLARPI